MEVQDLAQSESISRVDWTQMSAAIEATILAALQELGRATLR